MGEDSSLDGKLVAALFLVGALGTAISAAYIQTRASAFETWKKVDGVIVEARRGHQESRRSQEYGSPEVTHWFFPEVEYTYDLGELRYTGNRYAIPEHFREDSASIDRIVARLKPGTPTKVWYDPEDPQRSSLRMPLPWPWIPAVWLLAALLGCGALVTYLLSRGSESGS